MRLSTFATLICCFFFTASLIPFRTIAGARIIKVPKDYPRIQLAIDAANTGDTIEVASGTYFEKIRVTKSLSLIGEGPENTVITPGSTDGTAVITVVKVVADNVELTGFTVRNGTTGVLLWYSSGTLLRNNVMSGNKWNFGVWGDSLSHFVHDVDSSNMVDGKPVYYWLNRHRKQVPMGAGYVAIVNSTEIMVKDLELTRNVQGLLLVNTKHSLVENVSIMENAEGISLRTSDENAVMMNKIVAADWHALYLVSSNKNTFTENVIADGTFGIVMQHSYGNAIYHNNFINNEEQVSRLNSTNTWDDGKEGNYWNDYSGEDLDGDGVGDTSTPHLGVDRYPIIDLYDNTPPKADAGANQTIQEGMKAVFDASRSWDNIAIIAYEWDFGDDSGGIGVDPSHVYQTAGIYSVTLTVTDVSGKSSTDTIIVSVVDQNETLILSVFLAVIAGIAIILVTVIRLRYSSKNDKTCVEAKSTNSNHTKLL